MRIASILRYCRAVSAVLLLLLLVPVLAVGLTLPFDHWIIPAAIDGGSSVVGVITALGIVLPLGFLALGWTLVVRNVDRIISALT